MCVLSVAACSAETAEYEATQCEMTFSDAFLADLGEDFAEIGAFKVTGVLSDPNLLAFENNDRWALRQIMHRFDVTDEALSVDIEAAIYCG